MFGLSENKTRVVKPMWNVHSPHSYIRAHDNNLFSPGQRFLDSEGVVWMALNAAKSPVEHLEYCVVNLTNGDIKHASWMAYPVKGE